MSIAESRRRRRLGPRASAALPLVWAELARRGWSDAALAKEVDEATGKISRLLYGDRGAGRKLAAKLLARLGTPLDAWDRPCPVRFRSHPGKAESGTFPSDGDEPHAKAG